MASDRTHNRPFPAPPSIRPLLDSVEPMKVPTALSANLHSPRSESRKKGVARSGGHGELHVCPYSQEVKRSGRIRSVTRPWTRSCRQVWGCEHATQCSTIPSERFLRSLSGCLEARHHNATATQSTGSLLQQAAAQCCTCGAPGLTCQGAAGTPDPGRGWGRAFLVSAGFVCDADLLCQRGG